MNVHSFLNSAFKSSLSTFGSEEIVIGNTKIQATIDEVTSSGSLGRAAVNTERELTAQFPAGAYTGKLRSGMRVEARGQNWQISSEPESIRTGRAGIMITLIEPERRDE